MQTQTSGRFKNAVELNQAGGHHHQVGHYLVLADELAEGGDHGGDLGIGSGDELVINLFDGRAPVPGVVEGGNLGIGGGAGFVFEKDVIGAVGIEGRIQIDQVYGFILDIFT